MRLQILTLLCSLIVLILATGKFEDKDNIGDLLNSFNLLIDKKEYYKLGDIFTPDVTYNEGPGKASGSLVRGSPPSSTSLKKKSQTQSSRSPNWARSWSGTFRHLTKRDVPTELKRFRTTSHSLARAIWQARRTFSMSNTWTKKLLGQKGLDSADGESSLESLKWL